MTNREKFNQYIREELDRKTIYFENLSNEELIDYAVNCAEISVSIGKELNYFKATEAGLPIGTTHDVQSWLGEESRKEI